MSLCYHRVIVVMNKHIVICFVFVHKRCSHCDNCVSLFTYTVAHVVVVVNYYDSNRIVVLQTVVLQNSCATNSCATKQLCYK